MSDQAVPDTLAGTRWTTRRELGEPSSFQCCVVWRQTQYRYNVYCCVCRDKSTSIVVRSCCTSGDPSTKSHSSVKGRKVTAMKLNHVALAVTDVPATVAFLETY